MQVTKTANSTILLTLTATEMAIFQRCESKFGATVFKALVENWLIERTKSFQDEALAAFRGFPLEKQALLLAEVERIMKSKTEEKKK